jgi:hypothetical protein
VEEGIVAKDVYVGCLNCDLYDLSDLSDWNNKIKWY